MEMVQDSLVKSVAEDGPFTPYLTKARGKKRHPRQHMQPVLRVLFPITNEDYLLECLWSW